jgi:hypothetical protein
MTVYTQNLSVVAQAIQYHGTDTEVQDLAVGDTITASFDQQASSNQQTSLLDVEDNDIVFTLVNCTISPTNVKNRGTFTITPTTSGSNYSCVGVLVYYSPGGGSYGGPSANHQQTTFTISGVYGSPPDMGLQVWHPSNSTLPRLDTKDKQIMHYATYSGTIAAGASAITTTVGGGYDITNGDWGIDVTPINYDLKVISVTNSFTVSTTKDFGSIGWRVNIFKLNQT